MQFYIQVLGHSGIVQLFVSDRGLYLLIDDFSFGRSLFLLWSVSVRVLRLDVIIVVNRHVADDWLWGLARH